MRNRCRATVVLLVAIVGLAVGCQPERRDPASIERILLVGDSIVHGVPPVAAGLAGPLAEVYPNAQIVTLGGLGQAPVNGFVPGTVHSDWSGQVNHWLSIGFDADLVIIQACCNDYTGPGPWRASLDALIARARGHDPGGDRRILLLTTLQLPPGRGYFWRYYGADRIIGETNAVMRQIPGVALADLDFAWSVGWQAAWSVPGIGVVRSADELHFNEVGAREAARFLSRY